MPDRRPHPAACYFERMTATQDRVTALREQLVAWRRHLHMHPEVGFHEHETAQYIEAQLRQMPGLTVTRPTATSVLAVLKGGQPGRTALLRADIDALPITEENTFEFASRTPGVMHACGHDGHTATLLAAAWHLARSRDFAGTVHFIFQPAEEGLGGAVAMIGDGLLTRFPCDRIYAYHNFPGMAQGQILTRPGRIMAGCSFFTIKVQGRGGHAALPQTTVDAAQIASNIVVTAQSIVARNLDPIETGVVSFTDVYAGTNSHNVIPDRATLKGCLRFFDTRVGDQMRQRLEEVAAGVARTYGGHAEIAFEEVFVPLVNDPAATEIALTAAARTVGAENVRGDMAPLTGSEDFAFMIEDVPGNYVLVGAGPGAMPHNPAYDFNDAILPVAASYFCRLVETELA